MKNGEFVIPGEVLGVAEEFLPGEGAFEENGKIYSSVCGIVTFDEKGKKAFVVAKVKTPPKLKRGDVVICEVVDIKEKIVMVEILRLQNNEREITGSKKARIYISQSSKSYVKSLLTQFRVGDIVRAKVINPEGDYIVLSTMGPEFGVLRALCTRCRNPLVKTGTKLECLECSHIELRKTAQDYGKGRV